MAPPQKKIPRPRRTDVMTADLEWNWSTLYKITAVEKKKEKITALNF
jgi:hypothetical protein